MPSSSHASSSVLQNYSQSSCTYQRASKRKLQPQPEVEHGSQKVVVLECENMASFPETTDNGPRNPQQFLAPKSTINTNGNIPTLQQEGHVNTMNMQRQNDNFTAAEYNGAGFAKPVKNLHQGYTPPLPNAVMNEGQNRPGSVPFGPLLPMATSYPSAFPLRDPTEETQKATMKPGSTMDGCPLPGPHTASRLIPVNDEFDYFGQRIAAKLRCLPREQGILAEKLLDDVLNEAVMGRLNHGSRLLTPLVFGPPHGSLLPAANGPVNFLNLSRRLYGLYRQ